LWSTNRGLGLRARGVVGPMMAEEVGVSVAVGNLEDTNSPWPLYGTSS